MKKFLFSAASILLLLGSCSQNELEENVLSNGQNMVSATIEGQVDSRLAVEHDKTNNLFKLSWSTGDSFKVFDESEGAIYNWSSENDFTASKTPTNPTYAVYPYADTNSPTISGSTVTMTLSAAPSVENVNLPMWAGVPTNNNYAFKHLAAALQFTLNDIPAGYNQLIVTASNAISGTFTADLNSETPILSSASTQDVDKKVTVSFDAATTGVKNEVFYIPLPAGTYESLVVSVSKNGTETKELKSWSNLEVKRGKMYYTTATVDAATVEAVNNALANVGATPTTVNLTAAIDASAGDLDIPEAAKDVTLNFTQAPTTTESAPLVIKQNEDAASSEATSDLNVTMPTSATSLYATIDAPTTTVTLQGGSYSTVTATTATNTLIVKSGVKIEALIINGGNVVIEDGAMVTTITNNVSGNTITEHVTSLEALNAAIGKGYNVILGDDITSSEIIVINKPITLDGNGHTLTSSAGRAINVSGADANGVTVKNLTIEASGERAINIIQNATNVTIDDVTATAANYTVNVASSAPSAKVDIKNSTLTGLCTVNVSAASADVKVDSSTIYCNDNNTTEGESYSALSLNKEAVNGKITATNTTINVVDGSDSFKGRNGAENGEVTINGSTDGVVVMVAYITYPGSDYYHAFATLAKAVEFAKEGDVISLLRDIEISETIVVEKAVTIVLNDKTVTANCKKAFEICADVTIENGTIISQQRCVDTRTNVNLTLTDVTLKADTYYLAYGNQQPLTIGGSTNGTKVSMTNVTIDAGYQGYAIISFVKTELTATDSNLNGYAALYVKEGSDASQFNFNGSTLSGTTGSNDVADNSFATIVIEANSVNVTLDANSNLNSIGNHHTEFYIKEGTGSTVTGPNVE